MDVNFAYRRRIYLSNTDAAGVLYFTEGMSICHEAYEEWLQTRGISLQTILREQKIALPIVHCQIDFLRPIFCSDLVEVKVKFTKITAQDFAIAYQIYDLSSPHKLLVKAQTHHVCIDPKTRSRVSLPSEIKDLLSN